MTVLYFDTSALVKLYVRERGSDAAARLFDAPESLILVSELAFLELDSALHKKVVREEIDMAFATRVGELASQEIEGAVASGGLQIVTVDSQLVASASAWVRTVTSESGRILTALDALHLASVMKFVRLAPTFVSSDNDLLAVVEELGLPVIDPEEE